MIWYVDPIDLDALRDEILSRRKKGWQINKLDGAFVDLIRLLEVCEPLESN